MNEFVSLNNLVEDDSPITYGVVKPGEEDSNGVLFIRSGDIFDGQIAVNQLRTITNEISKQYSRTLLRGGELVISLVGNPGQVAIVPQHLAGANIARQVGLVRLKSTVCKEYIKYYLLSPEGKISLGEQSLGSVQQVINLKDLRQVKIHLPSLPKQRAIAGVLSSLDNKIELNRRMNATLNAIARAEYRERFVEREDIENWNQVVLYDLAESMISGDWGKDTNENGELLPAFCIRGADIPDLQAGGFGKMPLRYIKPASLSDRRLQDGDIVVEISGGSPTQSTGRPVLITHELLTRLEIPLVASNFCRVFRPKKKIVSTYIYFWLCWLYSKDEFFQYENGTTGIKNFAFTIFSKEYVLRLPPVKKLEEFHSFTSLLIKKMQCNAKESNTLAAIRDALLPKLLRGEVKII